LPDKPYYPWIIVATTLVNQAFSVGILIYSFALFVVPWLDEFGISRGRMMLAIVALQMVVGFVSPTIGRLLDTRSLRLMVLLGALSTGAGLGLLSQATAFWQVMLIHATLLPLGMVLCGTLASQTLVSKWFAENRGLAIGISAMGTSMGGFVFPLVTAQLLATYDWHGTLLIHALLCLAILIPLNFFILRVPPPAAEPNSADGTHRAPQSWNTREILTTRMFWIPIMGLIPINAAFGGVQFNLGALMSDLSMSQDFAAILISITSVSMIIGKLLFGMLGDRVEHRPLFWLMFGLMAAALWMYIGTPGRFELITAATLQGLATGGVLPMMGVTYSSRFGTLAFGKVLGLVNLFMMIGSFGSILSGWIFDLTGSYNTAFWTFLVLLIPAMIALYWLPPARNMSRLENA